MIKVENLSIFYNNHHAVKNLSITFPNSEITAIIGPNGCGKSTLLHSCCGIVKNQHGSVFVDEILLENNSKKTYSKENYYKNLAQKVSLLPQMRNIPDIVVKSLVLHGRFPWIGYPRVYSECDRKIAEASMKRADIFDKADRQLSTLSGGERQRAYIAMLLAQDTQNMLFDEPTTFLDIKHQLELQNLMLELKNIGKCIVAVFHDLQAALDIADNILVMKDGKRLAFGKPHSHEILSSIEFAFDIKLNESYRYKFIGNSPRY